MPVSLGELAVRFGCELRGDPDTLVDSIASLSAAHAGAVTFLANPKLRPQLADTKATAVVLDAKSADACPVAALVAVNPHATFARIAAVLYPRPVAPAGVHPSAVVAPDAKVDPTAHVGPFVVIGPKVVVGARAYIGPHSVLEEGVEVGEDVPTRRARHAVSSREDRRARGAAARCGDRRRRVRLRERLGSLARGAAGRHRDSRAGLRRSAATRPSTAAPSATPCSTRA